MKAAGAPPAGGGPAHLRPWEARAVDAVGAVIEFWGFKRNQGRVWALLLLRGEPRSAAELQDDLGLSKGAISTLTRELERWRVIHCERAPGSDVRRFAAHSNVLGMISRVLEEREVPLVARVQGDLRRAEAEARSDPRAGAVARARLAKLRQVADLVARSLSLFLETSRLDVTRAAGVLEDLTGLVTRPRRWRQRGGA